MSKEQVERFFRAVETDAVLRSALEKARIGEFGQPLVAFGKVHGFDFTLEELRARVAGSGAELTDEMLGHVAGGRGESSSGLDFKLQQMMDRQQQSLQVMSDLLKSSSDSQQAVIRKIGG